MLGSRCCQLLNMPFCLRADVLLNHAFLLCHCYCYMVQDLAWTPLSHSTVCCGLWQALLSTLLHGRLSII